MACNSTTGRCDVYSSQKIDLGSIVLPKDSKPLGVLVKVKSASIQNGAKLILSLNGQNYVVNLTKGNINGAYMLYGVEEKVIKFSVEDEGTFFNDLIGSGEFDWSQVA